MIVDSKYSSEDDDRTKFPYITADPLDTKINLLGVKVV
jgi:hypothetical protein